MRLLRLSAARSGLVDAPPATEGGAPELGESVWGQSLLPWCPRALSDPSVDITRTPSLRAVNESFVQASTVPWFSLCACHYRENQEDTGGPFTPAEFAVLREEAKQAQAISVETRRWRGCNCHLQSSERR